ncbi:MAG: GatB/YqeY domain-containing protein, partial [Gemmatimonadales bacterium]
GQVRAALTAARKNREADRTLLYSTLLSEFGNHEIALGHALSDAEALDVVLRAIKRRKESIEAYQKGGRTDLVDRESAELAALEKYLPPAVGPDEIRAAVKDAIRGGARDMGAVMGKVMPAFKGRTEGKLISQIVREELG